MIDFYCWACLLGSADQLLGFRDNLLRGACRSIAVDSVVVRAIGNVRIVLMYCLYV